MEYDPKTNLQHYPLPMGKYGKNPYGENLYRIVLASTRLHLVGGLWNGENQPAYHWTPRYPQVVAAWILERWYTAWEYTRMTQRKWDLTMVDPNTGWLINGPYPSRGEYDLAWEFDAGPANDSIDKIIAAIEAGRRRSFQDVRDAHAAEYDYEREATRKQGEDQIRDAVSAFGASPMSARGYGRGTKTAPVLKTAEELGLPTPSRRGGRKRTPNAEVRGIQTYSTLMTVGTRTHA